MGSTFVIIIPGFARNEQDTTCIPLSQSFIKAVNRLYPELEVIVITLDHPPTRSEYTWFGNRVIPLNGTGAFLRPILWLRLYRLLKRIANEKRLLGILNFWCADNALVTHYFTKRHPVQSFTWLQGQDARKTNKVLRLFKPKPGSLIALSDAIRKECSRNFGLSPVHLVYPGVDPLLFKENHVKDIDIIGVGSLTPLKQYHVFIEVVEQLKHDFPGIRTIIVGKGPEESRLQKIIVEKGLEHNIELVGEKDHSYVLQLMSRSRVLVHPSEYEGYGMVCLEGVASGCHVVSFVAPESRPVPQWHTASSPAEMINVCIRLLQPGTNYRQVFVRSIDDTTDDILQLYQYPQRKEPLLQTATDVITA